MPYKAIKKFEFDGVVFKIGDTVPDRLIVERLINSKIVEEFQNVIETPKVELLLETPSAIEVTVETTETVEEKKEELLTEETPVEVPVVPEVKENKKSRK